MPGMSGLDVARTMQSWDKSPTIVFLSMNDGEGYQAAARELGAMALVGKGDFVADLLPIIETLIAAQARRDATC
jgi:DNA-binding NarL/FixJ family response regulator